MTSVRRDPVAARAGWKGGLVKNLSLAAKMTVLVAVLVGAGAVIAAVGLVQLARAHDQLQSLVDTTGRALILASSTRIDLLRTVRGEKNAVLSEDKAQASNWVDRSRQNMERLRQHRAELASVVDASPATREGKALVDFDRAIEDFEKNNKEVLRLALVKSNAEGGRILRTDLFARARDVEDFVAGLGETVGHDGGPATRAADESRAAARRATGRDLLGQLYGLISHLSQHLDALDEKEMADLDTELRQRLPAFQETLRRLHSLLGDADRARGADVLTALEAVRSRSTQIQELSRANTDVRARHLTITLTAELADRTDATMAELIAALTDRLEREKRAASDGYALGRTTVIATGAVGLLAALLLAVGLTRSITRPVALGVQVFEAQAAGDLTRRMNLDRRDEIGRLGAASDRMAATLCGVVTQIRGLAARLGDSAGSLSGVSTDLLAQSHELATQASTVASGTEQLSANVSSMAAAAEQMSVNVASISSASEEVSVNVATISASADSGSRSVATVAESISQITASLQEVARDARQGSQMTEQAREMAERANQTMRQLDRAASEITRVTEVIKSIALQTNLLALNATIEATSAGEAGRGFAVVAGEIKELAGQSAQSAEDIARKIESVQESTCEAVKVIEDVARFVGELNVAAGRTSAAADAQTQGANRIAATMVAARQGVEDIARSIAEVAKGANDVSRNTSEVAQAATDVSRNATQGADAAQTISANIQGVSQAAQESNASAVRVDETARRLNEIASELQRGVAHFNTGQPAAAERHA